LDFWDLIRVLGRRWRISLPLFALSMAFTALIFTHVKPDYVDTAFVQLVPPVPVAVPDGQPAPVQRNPWLLQDLSTLGNAALVSVQDVGYVESLKNAGYTDSFTATMSQDAPQVTFQVTGKSAAQALATANKLVDKFNQGIESLQTTRGVAPVDLITPLRLDAGNNIVKSTSNVKRAIAAVGLAGILMTIAVTVGADAWLRRRRLAAMADVTADEPEVEAAAAVAALPEPETRRANTLTMTRLMAGPTNGAPPREAAQADRPEARPGSRRPDDYDVPVDATVVLPKATPALND